VSSARRRVVFRREALTQLEELYAIVTFCEDLAPFPLRGTARDDIRPGLRTIGFRRRAVVAFVVGDDAVVVLGVFYGGRDYEPVLRSDDWSD
jgi:toxin ParE1/3/4